MRREITYSPIAGRVHAPRPEPRRSTSTRQPVTARGRQVAEASRKRTPPPA
jgi:hypothetical protein